MKIQISDRPFWAEREAHGRRLPDDSINVAVQNSPAGVIGAIEFYNTQTYALILARGHKVTRQFGARFTAGQRPEILDLRTRDA